MAESKKKEVFKEDAKDGDGDGLVQDGTKFERPAAKPKKQVQIEHPEWFQELEAAPSVPLASGEPEAVTRMRDV